MQNTSPKPMSGMKHFWLSFLAVVTGVPLSLMIVSGVFFFGLVFLGLMLAASAPTAETTGMKYTLAYGSDTASSSFVAVPVRGVILSGSAADPLQTLFGQSYADGEMIKEQLMLLAEDSNVDGVILEIDSPGGMITASKAISDGVKYYQETAKKPIIAHINGTGASGAYWAAVATDAIYAEQGSEAGSIGVIMGPLVSLKGVVGYGDVATSQPIEFTYYSAGRSKDLGNPFRDVTPEEKQFINQQLQTEYEKFVSYVSSRRGIQAATIKNDIGALAYGTTDAVAKKLIDGESSKEQAYEVLADKTNTTDYKVLRIDNSVDFFSSLFSAQKFSAFRMSESEKSAARTRYCETNLLNKPLVFRGDIQSICK